MSADGQAADTVDPPPRYHDNIDGARCSDARIDGNNLTIADVVSVARRDTPVALDRDV
jgi:hypothetical protein